MSERESMVERVAKSIYSRDPGYDDVAWAELPADSFARLVCLDQARIAIFVLRDPTERMLSSADSAIPRAEVDADGRRMMGREVALEAWQAMIDEALRT